MAQETSSTLITKMVRTTVLSLILLKSHTSSGIGPPLSGGETEAQVDGTGSGCTVT